jgi:hypothetical protein
LRTLLALCSPPRYVEVARSRHDEVKLGDPTRDRFHRLGIEIHR